jgi:hypothetical protein
MDEFLLAVAITLAIVGVILGGLLLYAVWTTLKTWR